MAHLTANDVERLLREPSAEARAETVAKIATTFDSDLMDGRAREIAEDIFRYLLRDVEVRVRAALSENLKDTQEVTTTIAEVNKAALETGTAANQMLQSAGDLAGQADQLRGEVDKFLETMNAA